MESAFFILNPLSSILCPALKKLLLPATFLVAASQLLSRVLGIYRDHIFADIFGATSGSGIFQLDTYYAAFRLPDLVYSLLILGTLSAAFVPLLAEKGESALSEFASNVLNVLLVGVLILSAGIFVFAEPLTKLITPGFNPEQIALTAQLLRIQLLAPIFFSFSAVFGGLAQHFHRFAWYSLAPILYNAGIIFGALAFGKEFGVFGLSWGVALGAFLHAVIQFPGIFQGGFRWQAAFSLGQLREFFRLALPRVISVVAGQLQLVAITIFASLLGGGALAVFNYAWNLASLPLGVVGVAFAVTSFAALSKLADNPEKFRVKFHENFLGIFFWVIPASVGLFLLRTEITQVILQTGEFGANDVSLVASSLAVFAFAVPAVSLLPLLNNVFFARKNVRIPLLAGAISLGVVVLSALFLTDESAAVTLAAAYSRAAIIAAGTLLCFLPRALRRVPLVIFGKILLASAVLGGLVLGLRDVWVTESFFQLLWKVLVIIGFGGIFYLASAKFLRLKPGGRSD